MLKERIGSGSSKIKRSQERAKRHRQNTLFRTNQKKLYEELDGSIRASEIPDSEEASTFWRNIWSIPGEMNKNATWIPKVREKMDRYEKQAQMSVGLEVVRTQIRKMTNWKSPGPDGVQGYWFKRFTSLHNALTAHLQACVTKSEVPEWMTKGKTVLVQKDPDKGKTASNYRPIACLPLMWKLLTSVIAEKVYSHLAENGILPDEQKGCRRKSRGTKDQLAIDKQLLKHCKKHQRNLAMGWIDYKKAYDMVPHSWLLDAMRMIGVADNIVKQLEKSMPSWKTQLTASGELLGEIDINRGIFQGDSLSPLLFVIVLIPLSIILNDTDLGYKIENHGKINHLLFMDDLKLYARSERELDSLVQTVRIFSDDIGMEFGMDKCAVLVMKRGRVVRTEGIELPNGRKMKEVDLSGYKYLGVLQLDSVMNGEMKTKVRDEYTRRVKKLLRSELNGGNLIAGINAWAIGIIRYGAGILDWTVGELRDLDIKTRKMMTMNGCLHPRGNVARLYLPRKEGGRGLISCEECVNLETKSLSIYIKKSEEWMLKFVSTEMEIEDNEEIEDYKNRMKDEKREKWHSKPLHGKYRKEIEGVSTDRTWQWMVGGHIRKETEGLICAAQEQALRVNSIRNAIDGQDVSPMCRMCGCTNETVMHVASGCPVLAESKYLSRHDTVGKHIHWLLLKKFEIAASSDWYKHTPETVTESNDGNVVVYWNRPILTDRKVRHNRPDIVVIHKKEKLWQIIDVAIPMDHRVKVKEDNKVETYLDLAAEVRRQYQVKTTIVPIVIGALGAIPERLEKSLETLELPDVIGSLQTAVLIATGAIIRRVLNL